MGQVCCSNKEVLETENNLGRKDHSESIQELENRPIVSIEQFSNFSGLREPEEFKVSYQSDNKDMISIPPKLAMKHRFSTPNALLIGSIINNASKNAGGVPSADSKQLNRGHTFGSDRKGLNSSGASINPSIERDSVLNNAMICGTHTFSQVLKPSSRSNAGFSSHGKSSDHSLFLKMERIEEENN